MPATDWDAYYRHTATFAPITRRFTEREILRDVLRFGPRRPGHILELGGGNSAFLEALAARFPEARLTAIDTNALGLQRLRERLPAARLTALQGDVLVPGPALGADVVF